MKQKLLNSIRLRIALLVALLCSLGTGSVWADDYELVTDATDLAVGDVILITNSTTNGSVYALGPQSGNNCPAKSVTVSSNKISSKGDAQEITLESKDKSGYFTFQVGTTSYLYAASSSKNYLKAKTDKSYWSISINSTTYVASITDQTNSANHNKMKYNPNNGSPIFSCYTSADENLFVFKKKTYAITAQSNNTTYGTVSLSGTTITGAPADGCRYASPAYTVSSGTATVSQSGNAFTVTPSSDCTVTINFEAIPTHTLSSVVSPVGAGTVTFAATSIREGSTTTATADAAAGYKFTGWSISGTGASLSSTSTNPTTVTMGTADATVTATFEAVTTYPIHWSVNGEVVKTDNVEENTAIKFAKPTSGVPTGYTFRGWVTAANRIDGKTDTEPTANYVNSANSTAEITYYAVLAVLTERNPDTYEKLTSDEFETDATYVIGGRQDAETPTIWYLLSYENVDENSSWGVCTSDPATNTPIYFNLSGTAASLVAEDNSGNYLTGLSTGKFLMSSTSQTVYLSEDGYIRAAENGYYLRHNYNNGNGGLRWYATSNAMNAYFYKVISGEVYKHFCTTVEDYPVTIGSAGYTTYVTGDDVTMPTGVTAYIATKVNTNTIHIEEVENVPANEPIILKASAGTYYLPVITSSTDDVSANILQASTGSTTGNGSSIYALGVGKTGDNEGVVGFYLVKSGVSVPAGKAYLTIPAGVKEFLGFSFGDETGVKAIDNGQLTIDSDAVIFNLAGQRVNKAQKGLYILNGRKVLVK